MSRVRRTVRATPVSTSAPMFLLRTMSIALALTGLACQSKGNPAECRCTCTCTDKSQSTTAGAAAPSAAVGAPTAAADKIPAGERIVIGHVASMTGSEASWGELTDKGIRLAIEEQNRKGGIKGKQLVLKTVDDQGKPEEAAAAMTRLITQDHAMLVLGEMASSRSLAMAPVADSHQVPMISPASTNPKVTKDGDKTRPYVFRVCFVDPFQGTAMAKFARDVLKYYQVAVLRDADDEYSVGLANLFVNKFKELGGGILIDQSYKSGSRDFKTQLAAIKSKNPEAIFLPGYYTDVALIARQARELGMKQPFLGGDGWDSDKLYETAKGALDGSYFSNHYSEQDPSPAVQDFVRKYKAIYNSVPDSSVVLGYDAALVAIDAMERSRGLTGSEIREALEQTKGFRGVTGTISLDADHNAVKAAVVLNIEKNVPYYAATVTP